MTLAKSGGDGKHDEASHLTVRSVPSNSSTGTVEGEAGGATRISEDGTSSWVSQAHAPTDPVDDSDSDSELGDDPELLDDEANKIQEVAEYKVGHS